MSKFANANTRQFTAFKMWATFHWFYWNQVAIDLGDGLATIVAKPLY